MCRTSPSARRACSFSAGGQGGGAQTAAVNIRGIGQTDFQFPNEPGVGVYIDDVYYGISFGTAFDLVDLDRVEILRGPQGTAGGQELDRRLDQAVQPQADRRSRCLHRGDRGFVRAASAFAPRPTSRLRCPTSCYPRLTSVGKYVDGYVKRLDYECDDRQLGAGRHLHHPRRLRDRHRRRGQKVLAGRAALRWIVSDTIENNFIADLTHDRSEASPRQGDLPAVDRRQQLRDRAARLHQLRDLHRLPRPARAIHVPGDQLSRQLGLLEQPRDPAER